MAADFLKLSCCCCNYNCSIAAFMCTLVVQSDVLFMVYLLFVDCCILSLCEYWIVMARWFSGVFLSSRSLKGVKASKWHWENAESLQCGSTETRFFWQVYDASFWSLALHQFWRDQVHCVPYSSKDMSQGWRFLVSFSRSYHFGVIDSRSWPIVWNSVPVDVAIYWFTKFSIAKEAFCLLVA